MLSVAATVFLALLLCVICKFCMSRAKSTKHSICEHAEQPEVFFSDRGGLKDANEKTVEEQYMAFSHGDVPEMAVKVIDDIDVSAIEYDAVNKVVILRTLPAELLFQEVESVQSQRKEQKPIHPEQIELIESNRDKTIAVTEEQARHGVDGADDEIRNLRESRLEATE